MTRPHRGLEPTSPDKRRDGSRCAPSGRLATLPTTFESVGARRPRPPGTAGASRTPSGSTSRRERKRSRAQSRHDRRSAGVPRRVSGPPSGGLLALCPPHPEDQNLVMSTPTTELTRELIRMACTRRASTTPSPGRGAWSARTPSSCMPIEAPARRDRPRGSSPRGQLWCCPAPPGRGRRRIRLGRRDTVAARRQRRRLPGPDPSRARRDHRILRGGDVRTREPDDRSAWLHRLGGPRTPSASPGRRRHRLGGPRLARHGPGFDCAGDGPGRAGSHGRTREPPHCRGTGGLDRPQS